MNFNWLVLARHVVGLVIVIGVLNPYLYFSQDTAYAMLWWLVSCATIIGAAALLTALWALFFTARSRGHELSNYLGLHWTLAALILVGTWSSTPLANEVGTITAILLVIAIVYVAVRRYRLWLMNQPTG